MVLLFITHKNSCWLLRFVTYFILCSFQFRTVRNKSVPFQQIFPSSTHFRISANQLLTEFKECLRLCFEHSAIFRRNYSKIRWKIFIYFPSFGSKLYLMSSMFEILSTFCRSQYFLVARYKGRKLITTCKITRFENWKRKWRKDNRLHTASQLVRSERTRNTKRGKWQSSWDEKQFLKGLEF